MMKRRFTTITTILAGALAGNTAFFATQAIATQEMQPTAQVADQYMIIDLENIPLAQAQNNVDALIPDDTQLTEDSSSLSEQDEFEMSTEPKLLTLTNWMGWRVVCPKLILILPVH